MKPLILSVFPGIGMLDAAFERNGFCVVRGPDVLWGGDIHDFHPPGGGVFAGVIGGPPCQSHVRYAALNRAIGNKVAPDLTPEFIRIVDETQCEWFLMENSSLIPTISIAGFHVQTLVLNAVLFGLEQNRARKFQFGCRLGRKISPEIQLTVPETIEKACLASEGASGVISNNRRTGKQKSEYRPRRPWSRFCELQGLPTDFLNESPFTLEGRYRVVGNGVPLPMGDALAKSIFTLLYENSK